MDLLQLLADIQAKVQAAFDLGLAQGRAEAGGPDPKIYSQSELDAKIAEVQAGVDGLVASAKQAVKDAALAALAEEQDAENISEQGLKDKLSAL